MINAPMYGAPAPMPMQQITPEQQQYNAVSITVHKPSVEAGTQQVPNSSYAYPQASVYNYPQASVYTQPQSPAALPIEAPVQEIAQPVEFNIPNTAIPTAEQQPQTAEPSAQV